MHAEINLNEQNIVSISKSNDWAVAALPLSKRGLYPEAFAYYQRYVLEPLVCLLRILYTPAYTDYGFVHISQHIPKVSADRLTYFSQISSFGDIEQKAAEAKDWLDELVERVKL